MKSFSLLAIFAFAGSLLASDVAQPVAGTLCFLPATQSTSCSLVSGEVLKIPTADVERRFVWSAADGKKFVFGIALAKSEHIDLTDRAFHGLTLSVRGDSRHGWPEELRMVITGPDKKEWIWTVPAKSIESLSQLRLAAGNYILAFSADHHLTERRRVQLTKDSSLREVLLRPMPSVAGLVLSTKDQPIANAQILRSDSRLIGTTNEQGAFRAEAGEPLPDSLLVEKSGFGSTLVPLHLSTGDEDLGTIRLGTGVKLTLHIVRPDGNHDPLRVTLDREQKSKYELTPMGSKELPAADDTVIFPDLTDGKYSVIVEGKGALEKLVADATVGEADVSKEIKIEPYHLNGTAKIGDDPIDGQLGMNMSRLRLDMSLPIQNGQFSAVLWQHGKLFGWLKAKELGVEPLQSPDLGADPSAWDIRFPKRLISGRIYDADTQEAVPGAKLDLLRTSGTSRLYSSVQVAGDGTFSILAADAGTYELSARASDYVDMKQTIEVGEDDGSVERDFAMTHGLPVTLQATWSSGVPVANAPVMEGVASDGHNAERHDSLDASGQLVLRLQRGESRTLYIVPNEGSFAIAHVTAPGGSEPVTTQVVVPDPVGSLNIDIKTSDGKPAIVGIGMRFNGEVVPTPVLIQIGMRKTPGTVDERSLLQLPAGAYELWPISMKTFLPIGDVKNASVSAGPTNVELLANP